jgi:hypothetical protein
MRVPFIRVWKMRGANASGISGTNTKNSGTAVGDPVRADQGVPVPLPRRQPGRHAGREIGAVTADQIVTDPATLRKVLDGLNRM